MVKSLIIVLFALLSSFCETFAFQTPTFGRTAWTANRLFRLHATQAIDIVARNFELTDPIKEKTDLKVGGVLEKLGSRAISTKVMLQVLKSAAETTKTDVHLAEVTVNFKGGASVHVEEQSDNMYSTIDLVSSKLNEAMRRRRDKLVEKQNRKGKSDGSVLTVEEIEQLEALGDLSFDADDDEDSDNA